MEKTSNHYRVCIQLSFITLSQSTLLCLTFKQIIKFHIGILAINNCLSISFLRKRLHFFFIFLDLCSGHSEPKCFGNQTVTLIVTGQNQKLIRPLASWQRVTITSMIRKTLIRPLLHRRHPLPQEACSFPIPSPSSGRIREISEVQKQVSKNGE